MTAAATGRAPVTRVEVWEGARDDVASRCLAARRAGQLVNLTRPEPAPSLLQRDRVRVRVRVIADQVAQPAARRGRRRPTGRQVAIGAAATVGAGALAGVAYAVAVAVQWVAAHLVQIGVTLGALLIVYLFLRPNHRPTCTGLHCAGCKG